MKRITINLNHALPFIDPEIWSSMTDKTKEVDEDLVEGLGAGSDFLGWLELPSEMDEKHLDPILKSAEEIKKQSEVLIVIGIGGLYPSTI